MSCSGNSGKDLLGIGQLGGNSPELWGDMTTNLSHSLISGLKTLPVALGVLCIRLFILNPVPEPFGPEVILQSLVPQCILAGSKEGDRCASRGQHGKRKTTEKVWRSCKVIAKWLQSCCMDGKACRE